MGALLQSACGGGHEPRRTEAAERPPVPVKIVEARAIEWPSVYEAPGTVRARNAATISSKVMGYVREVRVQPGDTVRDGQVLVIIDSRDLESAVLQAQAAEQEARSATAEADNGVAAAKAQLTLAQVTFKRMDDLFQKKSISNQEFDEAQARLRTAEANYQMALSRRTQLDSKIAQAKQSVESASVMRSYAEIKAPFAGVVTDKRAESGQLATPGTPLLTIEQGGAFRLEAPVEESRLGSVRLGQTVAVTLDASGQTLTARVQEIVPAVDPVSRAFVVKAALPLSSELRSGLFGRLRLQRGSHQAIVVPAGAVSQRGELQTVFVVENGVARGRMVTTGQQHDGNAEVLSGLRPGERVVYPRPAELTDGARVEVRP
jgi:RND family efflux transporter MFP subunit